LKFLFSVPVYHVPLVIRIIFGMIPFIVSLFLTGVGCPTGRTKKEAWTATRRSCNCKTFCTCCGGEKGWMNKYGLDVSHSLCVTTIFYECFAEHVAC
jgi:hypothetical protein